MVRFDCHFGDRRSRGGRPLTWRRWLSVLLCALMLASGLHVEDSHADQAQVIAAQGASLDGSAQATSDDGAVDPVTPEHDHYSHPGCVGGAVCSMVGLAPRDVAEWRPERRPVLCAVEQNALGTRNPSPLFRPPKLSCGG